MKKKLLATLLAGAMVLSLTACGSTAAPTTEPAPAAEQEATAEEPAAEAEEPAAEAEAPAGDGVITLWVAEEVVDFTQEQCDKFFADNPDYAGFSVNIEPVGEGDAAGNMITDAEGGADIFGFAQDQLARLVSAGAVMPITDEYSSQITANNDEGSVGAATVGGQIYAFPLTSDNGYFLYYDSSVVSDPSTLEGIIADCDAAGKNFYMEINSAWYQTAFFFGTGCELTYDTDDQGNFTACNASYATPEGVVALRKMCELNSSSSFQNGSSLSNATNVAAIVDGTWDSSTAQELFGDNYACAKLPTFTGSDGKEYQMAGFGGFKLLGVKPQTDATKLNACLALANWLSGEEVQLARYQKVGWGPSNVNTQGNNEVNSDVALSALAEQLKFCVPQGQYPGDYWTLGTSLGDDVIAGTITADMTDDELMKVLDKFQETCITYAQ